MIVFTSRRAYRYLLSIWFYCAAAQTVDWTDPVPVNCSKNNDTHQIECYYPTWSNSNNHSEVRFMPHIHPDLMNNILPNVSWGVSVNLFANKTSKISGVLKMGAKFFDLHPVRWHRIRDTVLCDSTNTHMFTHEEMYVLVAVNPGDVVKFSLFLKQFPAGKPGQQFEMAPKVNHRSIVHPWISIFDFNTSTSSSQVAKFTFESSYDASKRRQKHNSTVTAFMWTHSSFAEENYCRSVFDMQQDRISDIVLPDPTSKYPPFRLSFTQKGILPVSLVSQPRPLQKGYQRWYVLLVHVEYGSVKGSVELVPRDLRKTVLISIMCAVVVPVIAWLTIVVVLRIGHLCPRVYAGNESWTVSCFSYNFLDFARRQCIGGIQNGGYTGAFFATTTAYLIAACQLSFSEWVRSQYSGDRDLCRFNFGCYTPAGIDMPFNSLLSHGSYFTCGISVLLRVLFADFRLHRACESQHRVDLCVFYALGITIILEGFGSMVYHMCPCELNFQFDTATMFVMALLSAIVFLDADQNIVTTNVIPPMGLVFLLVVPIWACNSINAAFDVYMHDVVKTLNISTVLYSVLVLPWCVIVWFYIPRLFPVHSDISRTSVRPESFAVSLRLTNIMSTWRGCFKFVRRNKMLCILRMLLLFGFLPIVFPMLRISLGTLSNISYIILGLSMMSAIMVVIRQLLEHSASLPCGCLTLSESLAAMLTFCVGIVAGVFFLHKTYESSLGEGFRSGDDSDDSGAAVSHDLNHACVLFDTFDYHDVWHMLSAAALALWIHTMLEIRLRIQRFQKTHGMLDTTSVLSQDFIHSQDAEMMIEPN